MQPSTSLLGGSFSSPTVKYPNASSSTFRARRQGLQEQPSRRRRRARQRSRNPVMKIHFVVMLVLAAGSAALAQNDEQKGAKELFFDPEQSIAAAARPGTATPSRAPKFDA